MRIFITTIILIGVYSISCSDANNRTLEYSRLNYDTNRITIFRWNTTKYLFPKNSEPLSLSQEDLKITDSLLRDAIDSFNTDISSGLYQAFDRKFPIDSFIIKEERYKYQYFPIVDVNGERVITIIGFSTDFQQWKTKVYIPGLHYGLRMIELRVNLSNNTRGNLRSGDFG